MAPETNEFIATRVQEWRDAIPLLEKLFTLSEPGAIFSEPIRAEGCTIITASEIRVGMGFGHGVGGGSAPSEASTAQSTSGTAGGMGAAGGGGGGAAGRPVAAIIVDEHGVRVEPVVDVTKIALAFFTLFGSMFFMASKMRRAARG